MIPAPTVSDVFTLVILALIVLAVWELNRYGFRGLQ